MRFERIGCHDVTALIGEGGMGQVYQATDTKLNCQVAWVCPAWLSGPVATIIKRRAPWHPQDDDS